MMRPASLAFCFRRRQRGRRPFSAFSLVELLVVIGILSLLAAILLPVFFTAREKARMASCAANLRQIGNGLQSYTLDYDGTYPPSSQDVFVNHVSSDNAATWRDLLVPYIKWFPFCPDRNDPWKPKNAANTFSSGYALNYYLSEALVLAPSRTVSAGISENTVKVPTLTVAVFDAREAIGSLGIPDTSANRIPDDPQPGATRHQNGANYLFADGHVKWLVPNGLRIDEKSDGIHPGFGL